MTPKLRLSASVDADLIAAAEQAVARGRFESVSAWVNEALRAKAEQEQRIEALGAFVAAYEKEHGVIRADEMRSAVHRAGARALHTAPAAARRRGRRRR